MTRTPRIFGCGARRTGVAAVLMTGTIAWTGLARAAGPPPVLVACAPGYPGSTAEAQPAMDALAAAAAQGAGLKPADLKAVYFETEKAGLDRLAAPDAALALVPLPFFLKHRAALRLEPIMQAVEEGGESAEAWTLVAAAGAITSPASLAGYDIVSMAGYAPRFVRGPALGAWGEVPHDATVSFSNAVLTGLRRASAGGRIAVLLDRAQAAALPTLPFSAKLQVVARSAPLPVSVLCVVGDRLPPAAAKAIVKGLSSLGSTTAGAAALAGVRMARFVPADVAALARARDAFDKAKE
jgi:hypothetical protein